MNVKQWLLTEEERLLKRRISSVGSECISLDGSILTVRKMLSLVEKGKIK